MIITRRAFTAALPLTGLALTGVLPLNLVTEAMAQTPAQVAKPQSLPDMALGPKDAKVTTKWTFNGKQVVKQDTQTISPTGGENVTEFHIDKKTAWPKGKYTVEVLLNGVSAGTKDLEVK